VVLGKQTLWRVVLMHFLGLEPAKWDFTVRTIFGSKISASTRDAVGRYIFYFGVWEPNLTRWIRHRLLPSDAFIDVGANIGYYSLLASHLVGDSGKVVAVEGLPAIFSLLQRNLETNKARNVRAVNVAAWDREQMIEFYTDSDLPGQTTAIPFWADKHELKEQTQVTAAPLADILTAEEMKAARLIKIDVEGAEWRVLAGMKSLLDSSRDDLEIIVEISPSALEAEGRAAQELLDFFRVLKFNAYRIENDYSVNSYLNRSYRNRPSRILRLPTGSEQSDIIFSRIDADFL
jgi:FkbM family methyltransferase